MTFFKGLSLAVVGVGLMTWAFRHAVKDGLETPLRSDKDDPAARVAERHVAKKDAWKTVKWLKVSFVGWLVLMAGIVSTIWFGDI